MEAAEQRQRLQHILLQTELKLAANVDSEDDEIVIKLVDIPEKELVGILNLQTENLKRNCDNLDEGFVTAEYSLEFLWELHRHHPSVVAMRGRRVVGYALAAHREPARSHALLSDLIGHVEVGGPQAGGLGLDRSM